MKKSFARSIKINDDRRVQGSNYYLYLFPRREETNRAFLSIRRSKLSNLKESRVRNEPRSSEKYELVPTNLNQPPDRYESFVITSNFPSVLAVDDPLVAWNRPVNRRRRVEESWTGSG